MKIEINGFRNIEHVEYEVSEGKHNFLFGLSGSGKSSISASLSAEELTDLDLTFGKSLACSITIDGKDRSEFTIGCFDVKTKERYFSEERNKILRLFLFDEDESFKKTKEAYLALIQGFINELDAYMDDFKYLSDIIKDAKADKLTNKDSTLRATAPTNKIITELKRIGDNSALRKLLKIDSVRYKWLKEGIGFFDINADRICPFCNREIRNKKTLSLLEKIQKYDGKSIGDYKNIQASLEEVMKHRIQESIESLEEVNKKLVEVSRAVKEFEFFRGYLERLFNIELFNKKIPPYSQTYGDEVKNYFKGIERIVHKVNRHIDRINGQYDSVQKKTEKVLKNKSGIINEELADLDIPYVLKVKYISSAYNEYYLIHKDNPDCSSESPEKDNYICMSEGEKTIVSLLFFIEQCRKDAPNIIVFDDPVSSYDEYRRGKILKIIQKRLSNKTVLILSHDQVFAKYALYNNPQCKGSVCYLNHFESPHLIEVIGKEDFVSYRDYVLSKVTKCSDYLLKIAYLRGLFEANHGSSIYGYMSAILHGYSKEIVTELLHRRKTTEENVLAKINVELGIKLEKYDDSKLNDICLDSFDFYEKCLISRLFAEEGQPFHDDLNEVFDELSDFLHVNQTLEIGLDPSKYHFCSRKLYSMINSVARGTHSLRSKSVL